jgi:hypothetical protein
VRLTVGAALIALVAVGGVLAELDPIVVVALTAAACVLVALVGRAYAREAAPTRDERPGAEDSPSEALASPELAEVVDVEPEREPEPELAVSERSARAILASGPPPMQAPPQLRPEPGANPHSSRGEVENRNRSEASRGASGASGSLGEFDELLRDSFGELLAEDGAWTGAEAAS